MSFYKIIEKEKKFEFDSIIKEVSDERILNILDKEIINREDFIRLLSPKAEKYIEEMAQKAKKLSLQYFGKAVLLYTPIYISNYCSNYCTYCSFNSINKIKRRKLTLKEIELEAKAVASTGLKHVLLLTGSSKKASPIDYIISAVEIMKKYFESIAIEVYPLQSFEYNRLIKAGVDGVTIYQEVYDEKIYKNVHLKGPKRDYIYRLNTPERACKEGINRINIGALLGLHDFRKELFFTGLHGKYLTEKYPAVEMGFSLPRLKDAVGNKSNDKIKNLNLVQGLLALRLFLPHFSINISTRESFNLRKKLIHLGVNKMSAGVSTAVGGHIDSGSEKQFMIEDKSSVSSVKNMILEEGYQPVMKDWFRI